MVRLSSSLKESTAIGPIARLVFLPAILLGLFLALFSREAPGQTDSVSSRRESMNVCGTADVLNARACSGAYGDAHQGFGTCFISASSSTLTCAKSNFVPTDIGKTIYVAGAGVYGKTLGATIAAYRNANQVTLSASASTIIPPPPATGALIYFGHDDTAALQAAYELATCTGANIRPPCRKRALYIPSGTYFHHGLNWTGNSGGRIYGDGYDGTDLAAVAVTNPGKINPGAQSVGVDISASSYNEIDDISFFGGLTGFADLAPEINLFGGRVNNVAGPPLAVGHTFERIYSETYGDYSVVLYGYEQTDFHDSQFQVNGAEPVAALYLSSANTPRFISPYVTLMAAPISMTKVSITGARSEFEGRGDMVVLDQGTQQGIYTLSIRDAYASMAASASGKCAFLSDTGATPPSNRPGQSALRHIVLDTVYIETESNGNCSAVNINGPAWNWRLDNVQKYSYLGNTVPQFIFAGGFLDSEAMIDSVGQAPGYSTPEFSTPSCLGSVLHLGQQQPTTDCRDYASLHSNNGTVPGAAYRQSGHISDTHPDGADASIGHAACWKTKSKIGYCSSPVDAKGSCTCN